MLKIRKLSQTNGIFNGLNLVNLKYEVEESLPYASFFKPNQHAANSREQVPKKQNQAYKIVRQ